jgi:hypothetical protein
MTKFRVGDKVVVSGKSHRMFGRTGRVDRVRSPPGDGYVEIDIDAGNIWTVWHEDLMPDDAISRLGLIKPF